MVLQIYNFINSYVRFSNIVPRGKKSIIITGASSGLGKAIAIEYAKKGNVALALFARSDERLRKVAKDCEEFGAEVETYLMAVEEKEKFASTISKIAEDSGIDIVVACAGVSAGTLDGPETASQVERIFATNLQGSVNTIMPAIAPMIARRKGNIVIIASMAGLIGLSSSPAYSASKGAIKLFGEALAAYLRKYGVKVTIAIPGFIKTPMTDANNFPMPFMVRPEKAAKKIVSSAEKGKLIVAFPLVIYLLMKLLNLFPASLISYFNSKLPGKPKFVSEDQKV